ncbi:MAG: ABC transporter permease [Dehalococcoidia bacterium]
MNAILTIAQRDLNKLLRDPARMLSTFVFPFIFMAALGGTMQASLGSRIGFDFLVFTFTGVFGQTLFQSSAMGLVSLIEDRQNDFSQEIFVAPISRYTIVMGKVIGETLVALPQGLAILAFALVLGIPLGLPRVGAMLAAGLVACLLGAAFGLLVLSNLRSQRAAEQVFPFILLPQFFLAGVFNPLQGLPWYLDALSRISPMRYAVDLIRDAYYAGASEYPLVVLDGALVNLAIIGVMFAVFFALGTVLFVRAEHNR